MGRRRSLGPRDAAIEAPGRARGETQARGRGHAVPQAQRRADPCDCREREPAGMERERVGSDGAAGERRAEAEGRNTVPETFFSGGVVNVEFIVYDFHKVGLWQVRSSVRPVSGSFASSRFQGDTTRLGTREPTPCRTPTTGPFALGLPARTPHDSKSPNRAARKETVVGRPVVRLGGSSRQIRWTRRTSKSGARWASPTPCMGVPRKRGEPLQPDWVGGAFG